VYREETALGVYREETAASLGSEALLFFYAPSPFYSSRHVHTHARARAHTHTHTHTGGLLYCVGVLQTSFGL
jgi:hypothetical protein